MLRNMSFYQAVVIVAVLITQRPTAPGSGPTTRLMTAIMVDKRVKEKEKVREKAKESPKEARAKEKAEVSHPLMSITRVYPKIQGQFLLTSLPPLPVLTACYCRTHP